MRGFPFPDTTSVKRIRERGSLPLLEGCKVSEPTKHESPYVYLYIPPNPTPIKLEESTSKALRNHYADGGKVLALYEHDRPVRYFQEVVK